MKRKKVKSSFYARKFDQIKNSINFVTELIPKSFKLYKANKKTFNSWLLQSRKKIQNPALTNFNLGLFFYNNGKIKDALMRFKLSKLMRNDEKIDFYIGKCYLSLGKNDKAKEFLIKTLENNKSHIEATYLVSLIDKEYKQTHPNAEIIKENIEIFSLVNYVEYLENINYQGHNKISEKFMDLIEDKSTNLNILDLGCSNGYIGMKLREFSSDFSITGLDFSKKMIEISKNHEYNIADVIKKDSNEIIQNNKNLQKESIQKSYDILVNDDFYNFSETKKPKYQFILAKGFLDYTYSLKKFFETSYNILDKKGQIILFSRCKIDDKVEIKLKKERSFPFYLVPYCHSEASIKNAAKNAKFEVISCEEFELESDVDANIFVIEKR